MGNNLLQRDTMALSEPGSSHWLNNSSASNGMRSKSHQDRLVPGAAQLLASRWMYRCALHDKTHPACRVV